MEWRSFKVGGRDYIVDELGRVPTKNGMKFKKPIPDKDGYLKYTFWIDRHSIINVVLHRLVYQVFNGTIPDGMTVDHKDNNKLNNHPSNLQLMTPEDNAIKGNARLWLVEDPQGTRYLVYNLERFCKDNGLHSGHMREVAKRYQNRTQCKGWKCYDFSNN